MGTTTKGIMLSGVYMMLGIFTLSFNSAESTNGTTAANIAKSEIAEQYARVGISKITETIKNHSTYSTTDIPRTTLSIDGVAISYSWTGSIGRATSVAIVNGEQVTMTSYFKYFNGRWRIAGTKTNKAHL